MAKFWIDPNDGWQYGFPKIWDEEHDKPVPEWMVQEGWPADKEVHYVRSWKVEELTDAS